MFTPVFIAFVLLRHVCLPSALIPVSLMNAPDELHLTLAVCGMHDRSTHIYRLRDIPSFVYFIVVLLLLLLLGVCVVCICSIARSCSDMDALGVRVTDEYRLCNHLWT